MASELTVTFRAEASSTIEKIQTLLGAATPEKALEQILANEIFLLEHVAKGWEVQLHKRGAQAKAVYLNP